MSTIADPPLYQLLEDAILERLEDRITAAGLKFYAYEAARKIEMPAIIVRVSEDNEDPEGSCIYSHTVTATLRAKVAENSAMTRDTFGSIFATMKEALASGSQLRTALTSGRLRVFGAEYQEESESDLEASTAERSYSLRILAGQLSGATTSGGSLVAPDPPAAGYWVSASGSSEAAGTYDDPWDFISALDGTQVIEAGSTIWFKAGYYSAKWGTSGYDSRYFIGIQGTSANPILLKPDATSGSDAHVQIDGRLQPLSGANHVHIYNFDFNQTTPLPVTEPTEPGSAPASLDQWGAAGFYSEVGDGFKLINCQVRGRHGQSLQAWSGTTNFEAYGCILSNGGWEGSDRAHGHAIYSQNDATAGPTGASTKTFTRCLTTTIYASSSLVDIPSTTRGYALHLYTSSGKVQNFTVDECFFLGAVICESTGVPCKGISITDCIITSGLIGGSSGTDGKGCSIGNSLVTDEDCTFTGNKLINTITRVANGIWTSLTMSGVTLYKTDASWWGTAGAHTTPGVPVSETLTFSDVSGGGGTDAVTLWTNAYDSKRAYFVALALDNGDDDVAFDPSSFLTSGDTYTIHRFKNGTNIWGTADYSGTWTSGNITVTLDDTTQRAEAFIIQKS